MEKLAGRKEVKMYFVIPNGSTVDEVEDLMKMAFQESKEASLSPQWIQENECSKIPPAKSVVFVLQEFNKDSAVFNQLRSTKSLVCGPMCLRSCLAENRPIPDNKSPVFTTAMRGLVITASQVSVPVKAEIKEKVGFMGGVYTTNLSDSVTHLVTNAVRSAKYEVAGEKGLPIMMVEWVDAAWGESRKRNIRATDPELMACYKLPVFYKMFIACSNISKKEKEDISKLVTDNGGTFTAGMRQTETTLLVVSEPKGEKYQFARSWGLPCVRPSYIYESVAKGFAVPSKEHLVEPVVSCSTPTKEDEMANFTYNSDPSISVINYDINKTHVDETQVTNVTQLGSQQRLPPQQSGSHYSDVLKKLTISDAKKSGSFVDGCKVYLSGFSGVESEKLVRILSLGGASVFTELSESVSHVLLGEFIVDDVRALSGLAQKPHVVSLGWLAASMKQKAPALEEPYYCLETRKVVPEPPSPLSQKGVQLLKPQFDASETSMMPPPSEPTVNRKLFSEFVKENAKSPAKQQPSPVKGQNQTMSLTSSQDSAMPEIFLGKNFLIVGFDSDMTQDMEAAIEQCGGSVVAANFKGVADFALVPVNTAVPNVTAMEVATNLWLEDCTESKALLEIMYYHQPFSVDPERRPLSECCVTFSSYYEKEKVFLIFLAEALGAVYQDTLVKVPKIKDDVELIPSTHLICPKPEGRKFAAASKWGVFTVSKDWLLACGRTNSRAPEQNFIVSRDGDSSNNTMCNTKTPSTKEMKTPDSGFETPKPSSTTVQNSTGAFKTPNVPAPADNPTTTPTNTSAIPHPVVTSLKRKSSAATPDDQSPFHMATPDTPYGQAIATPTNQSKKRWKRFIDDFDDKPNSPTSPTKNTRRQSTPLSELKRRAFAKALETSEENINPNYSIEEMEEDPGSEANQPNSNLSQAKEDCTPPSQRSTRNSLKAKNRDGDTSVRAAAAWNTPSASDFKAATGTPSSQQKKKDTPPLEVRSTENEIVSKMLGDLKKRISTTPKESSEEKRPYPNYKHLANQPSSSSASKPEANTILDPESQPILIGWEDPVEAAEKARMMSVSSPSTNKPRKFVLSNVADKEATEETLRGLGETVLTGTEFEQDTTHLIVDRPLRSEKLLCCLAGGRWVLHTSFIDRMVLCGKYVPEEEKYEWGNPTNSSRLPSLPAGDIGRELAQAAYRWRKKVNGTSNGAFIGMKAMLFTTPAKLGSYQRLITAGGGVVLPSVLSSVSSATHCFMELNKVRNLSVPLSEFVAHKVPCLPPIFLGEMITNPAPNLQDSLIPEYKKLLALRK